MAALVRGRIMQVLITGAAGKLGQILQSAWADLSVIDFEPIWCSRQPSSTCNVFWDILTGAAPEIPKGAVIVHLAGILHGDKAAMAANTSMALKVCHAAKVSGAAHVFLASSAAVYGAGAHDHAEVEDPFPCSDYGRAKLHMEREALFWVQKAGPDTPGLTCLRIGNVLGADALFAAAKAGHSVVLDDVPGQRRGPIRSYIGPRAFAQVLVGLVDCVNRREKLPKILNVAASSPVHMADLLAAAEMPFHFGPPNADVSPKVSLFIKRLAALLPVPQSDASALVADWRSQKVAAP